MARSRGLHRKTAILAGVMPVKSAKVFHYMNKYVPGIRVPDALTHRLETTDDPKTERLKICLETIKKLKGIDGVRGIHIMAVEWEEIVSVIVTEAKLR